MAAKDADAPNNDDAPNNETPINGTPKNGSSKSGVPKNGEGPTPLPTKALPPTKGSAPAKKPAKAKSPAVIAAGAVVLRVRHDQRQVLVVHRPRYDDWTLPKGKPDPDEALPVAAVREVREETGVTVRLSYSLGSTQYSINKGPKQVHWWLGTQLHRVKRKPDKEVDEVRWVGLDEARRLLTYADEVDVLDRAETVPDTATLIIVRHAKAMLRKDWSGKDWKRPITSRGRRQSKHLAKLLAAFGVGFVASSSATRCVQTLQPYVEAAGLQIRLFTEISEEYHERKPAEVSDVMQACVGIALAGEHGAVAVCGHRPVLPDMRTAVGAEPAAMQTAECLVLSLDEMGLIADAQVHRSRF